MKTQEFTKAMQSGEFKFGRWETEFHYSDEYCKAFDEWCRKQDEKDGIKE